jgi:3-oxoacyl-[acyl-carrier-protein] synthase-3
MALDELTPVAAGLLRDAIEEVLVQGGCRPEDVAHFFLHYVDPRAVLRTAEGLGIPSERMTATAARAGHVGAASLPIALSQAWGAGAVRAGDLVCLAGVGAGINSGAVLVRL